MVSTGLQLCYRCGRSVDGTDENRLLVESMAGCRPSFYAHPECRPPVPPGMDEAGFRTPPEPLLPPPVQARSPRCRPSGK
ncbi:hypothetical protein AB0G74_21715 [Streptomyces sp. NPDC020875]|uniref:hypothetical protein n=1 Tax=Streptomyces sp. NPDC020875 TaxID=3154898 RepID=UPI0033DBE343